MLAGSLMPAAWQASCMRRWWPQVGEKAASASWASGSSGGPAPFQLIMQKVGSLLASCFSLHLGALVLYAGPACAGRQWVTPAAAVWSTNTATGDPNCQLLHPFFKTDLEPSVQYFRNLIQVVDSHGHEVFGAAPDVHPPPPPPPPPPLQP